MSEAHVCVHARGEFTPSYRLCEHQIRRKKWSKCLREKRRRMCFRGFRWRFTSAGEIWLAVPVCTKCRNLVEKAPREPQSHRGHREIHRGRKVQVFRSDAACTRASPASGSCEKQSSNPAPLLGTEQRSEPSASRVRVARVSTREGSRTSKVAAGTYRPEPAPPDTRNQSGGSPATEILASHPPSSPSIPPIS